MKQLDERFADWVDGRLPPAERAALEEELRKDPELARAAADYRRTVQLVQGALAPEPMPRSVADRVLASLDGPATAPRAVPRLRPLPASLMAAAALLLAFAIVWAIPPGPAVGRLELARDEAPAGGELPDLSGVRPAGAAEAAPPADARPDRSPPAAATALEDDKAAMRSDEADRLERKAAGEVAGAQQPRPDAAKDEPARAADAQQQPGAWREGLGELALVVELPREDVAPRYAAKREADSGAGWLDLLTGAGAEGSSRGGITVREVVAQPERRDRGQPTAESAAPPERVFLVEGAAAAVGEFARGLREEVAGRRGTAHGERLGEQLYRFAREAPKPAEARPAEERTKAQPTGPAPVGPPAAPAADRVRLHVILRAAK